MSDCPPPWPAWPLLPIAPWRLSGVVVEALLNDPATLAALGDAVHAAPYKAPPTAPVLGVKPRNTLCGDGARVAVPAEGVCVAAQLAAVIGRPACAVGVHDALAHVAGFVLAVDLHLPLASHYRPAVRQRVRDGFCPLGPVVLPAAALADAEALDIVVQVDGQAAATLPGAGRVRPLARLIADVSAFMTLHPGDLLLLGAAHGAPLARAGQAVSVHAPQAPGLGTLAIGLVAEPGGVGGLPTAGIPTAPEAA